MGRSRAKLPWRYWNPNATRLVSAYFKCGAASHDWTVTFGLLCWKTRKHDDAEFQLNPISFKSVIQILCMRRCKCLCRTLGDFLWPLISERTKLVIEAKIFPLLPDTEFFNTIGRSRYYNAPTEIRWRHLLDGNCSRTFKCMRSSAVLTMTCTSDNNMLSSKAFLAPTAI